MTRAGWRGRDHRPPPDVEGQPRLFFAIPIPEAPRDAIAAVADRVRESVDGVRARWVRFDGLHLTLRFLGPTPVAAVPELAEALAAVARRVQPFEVALGGGGAFPNPARPRTLWIGVQAGGEQLTTLADGLAADPRVAANDPGPWPWRDQGSAPAPLPPRRFSPHLTIARTDGVAGAGRLAAALQAEAARLEVRFVADRVVLYESVPVQGPARYEELREAALGG